MSTLMLLGKSDENDLSVAVYCVQQCQSHHSDIPLQTPSSLSPLLCQNTSGGSE